MQILKSIEEIKQDMLTKRSEMIKEKASLVKRWESGVNFFLSTKEHSKYDIEKASETMREITQKIDKLTKDIFDLDIIVGTKLETLFSDFVIRITVPTRCDESGDKHHAKSIAIDYYSDDERETITPEDLWTLKILKQALNYQNIEVIKRKGD